MSFEPASPISIIVCDQCQGQGITKDNQSCSACQGHGVYALLEKQPIAFNLPTHIDLSLRKKLKINFILKRTILFSVTAIIIFLIFLIFSYA